MEADKSLVSGSMALLVLKLLEDGDKYGYQMTSELRQRSEDVFHLKAGTLYPLLHSLEEKGLVTAYEREAAAGKPRRYYHLTKADCGGPGAGNSPGGPAGGISGRRPSAGRGGALGSGGYGGPGGRGRGPGPPPPAQAPVGDAGPDPGAAAGGRLVAVRPHPSGSTLG